MHRIERNDLNLNFVGMIEENDILELALTVDFKNQYLLLKNQRQHLSLVCCFTQIIRFFPSENAKHTNDSRSYYPEYLGNIVFTSYFSVLKINTHDRIHIYRLTALPFFIAQKEIGKEVFGCLK